MKRDVNTNIVISFLCMVINGNLTRTAMPRRAQPEVGLPGLGSTHPWLDPESPQKKLQADHLFLTSEWTSGWGKNRLLRG
jgi:hypothetical protein